MYIDMIYLYIEIKKENAHIDIDKYVYISIYR